MSGNGAIEKYDYLRRVNTLCDLIAGVATADVNTPDELQAFLPKMLATMPEYHASLVPDVFPEFIAALLKPKNRTAACAAARALKHHLGDLGRAIDEGRPIVGTFAAPTGELFAALGLVGLSLEVLALVQTAVFKSGIEAEIDMSELAGFPSHVCNMQRAPMMAIEKGSLPKFDVVVKPTAPCNSSNMLYQYGLEKYGVEVLSVDCPYYNDQRAFEFYLEEFRAMVASLERLAGRPLDEAVLRKHVEMGNQQMRYLYGLQELRKHRPNPDPGMHRAYDIIALYHCGQNQLYLDYMKTVFEEARARHEEGKTFVPEGKQEIRTVWTWGLTTHMLYMYDWLEEEFGATFLECGITYVPSDVIGLVDTSSVDSMIRGLARRTLHYPMVRQTMGFSDVYVGDMVRVATDYGADAAVFSGNQSCKHSWAAAKRISDALMEQPGIPSLTWETDLGDKRYTPHATTKTLLREFFSTFE